MAEQIPKWATEIPVLPGEDGLVVPVLNKHTGQRAVGVYKNDRGTIRLSVIVRGARNLRYANNRPRYGGAYGPAVSDDDWVLDIDTDQGMARALCQWWRIAKAKGLPIAAACGAPPTGTYEWLDGEVTDREKRLVVRGLAEVVARRTPLLAPGTMVQLEDGTSKPVEDICEGDVVASTSSGKTTSCRVDEVIPGSDDEERTS